ncbi:MAG: mechanosensitive ion channel family protein, partial [Clostridia bacterium]|nr:mechanosensitive ion channel family protein [Clostridia bacterium]
TVEDIRLCNTKIRTLDNKVVYIPNGTASTSSVTNYSEKNLRRVDIEFAISYDSDVEKAKALIAEVAAANEKVLTDPEPFVRVLSYDANSVKLVSRSWVNSADYWDVFFYLTETVRKSFDENGIRIPFNQVDVHIKNDGTEA